MLDALGPMVTDIAALKKQVRHLETIEAGKPEPIERFVGELPTWPILGPTVDVDVTSVFAPAGVQFTEAGWRFIYGQFQMVVSDNVAEFDHETFKIVRNKAGGGTEIIGSKTIFSHHSNATFAIPCIAKCEAGDTLSVTVSWNAASATLDPANPNQLLWDSTAPSYQTPDTGVIDIRYSELVIAKVP
jgi:hypothetical protein